MKLLSTSILSVLVVFLLLAGCTAARGMVASGKERIANPAVSKDDLRAVVDENNVFALDLYQSLRSENGNLVSSPYSISLALAMTYGGARGQTETQMAKVLHFSQPQDRLHSAFNALDLALETPAKDVNGDQQPLTLNIANAVWTEKTFHFQQDFLDLLALNYGAGIHLADFIQKYEPARMEINAWVSDRTNRKIQNLLAEGSVDTDTRMVLVNAIYFKADWLSPFNASRTADSPFTLPDGTQVMARMMNQTMSFPYVQGDSYQAVELPYAGNTAAMDIILPAGGNFEIFDSSFNKDKYDEIIGRMQYETVDLSLPKFTFSRDSDLKKVLSRMGMPDAFDRDLADFSGMTGGRILFIENVFHRSFVAVDEKGTEAAAATAVMVAPASLPVTMTVNRPFLFIIRDKVSGQILFMGRVLNPNEV